MTALLSIPFRVLDRRYGRIVIDNAWIPSGQRLRSNSGWKREPSGTRETSLVDPVTAVGDRCRGSEGWPSLRGQFRLDFLLSVLSKDLLVGRVDPVEVTKTVCVSLDLVAPGNGKTSWFSTSTGTVRDPENKNILVIRESE